MNQLRVLSLTTLLLMLASRLPGQFGQPPHNPSKGRTGTPRLWRATTARITFSVARAYREVGFLLATSGVFAGWYNVDPGKCKKIGGVRGLL